MMISTSSIHKEQSKTIDPKKLEHFFSGQGGQPGSSGSSDKVGPDGLYFNLNDNAGRGSNGHNGVHAGSNGDNDLFSTSGGLNSPFRYVSVLNFPAFLRDCKLRTYKDSSSKKFVKKT